MLLRAADYSTGNQPCGHQRRLCFACTEDTVTLSFDGQPDLVVDYDTKSHSPIGYGHNAAEESLRVNLCGTPETKQNYEQSTLKMLLTRVLSHGWSTKHVHYTSAFAQAELEEEVYAEQSRGFSPTSHKDEVLHQEEPVQIEASSKNIFP
jgi:hypothetical protein